LFSCTFSEPDWQAVPAFILSYFLVPTLFGLSSASCAQALLVGGARRQQQFHGFERIHFLLHVCLAHVQLQDPGVHHCSAPGHSAPTPIRVRDSMILALYIPHGPWKPVRADFARTSNPSPSLNKIKRDHFLVHREHHLCDSMSKRAEAPSMVMSPDLMAGNCLSVLQVSLAGRVACLTPHLPITRSRH